MNDKAAKTTEEWVFVARSVGALTDGEGQAMRCMAMAGMKAESVSDWVLLARAWNQEFDDSDLAKQCMARAEAEADAGDEDDAEDEVNDWTLIGDVWAEIGYHKKAVENYPREIRAHEMAALR